MMRMVSVRRSGTIAALLAIAFLVFSIQIHAQFGFPGVAPASTLTIPEAQWLQPEALLHLLKSTGENKPLLLQVGSHVLFAQGHIPGSEYVGPGSQPAGLQQLQMRVSPLSRKRLIVLYCGCCPWNRCPNLGPAYATLHEMGFTHVKVLYLANNFGADWAGKGYPVEQGQ
jgi:rhodanese-related sulfurtransferase